MCLGWLCGAVCLGWLCGWMRRGWVGARGNEDGFGRSVEGARGPAAIFDVEFNPRSMGNSTCYRGFLPHRDPGSETEVLIVRRCTEQGGHAAEFASWHPDEASFQLDPCLSPLGCQAASSGVSEEDARLGKGISGGLQGLFLNFRPELILCSPVSAALQTALLARQDVSSVVHSPESVVRTHGSERSSLSSSKMSWSRSSPVPILVHPGLAPIKAWDKCAWSRSTVFPNSSFLFTWQSTGQQHTLGHAESQPQASSPSPSVVLHTWVWSVPRDGTPHHHHHRRHHHHHHHGPLSVNFFCTAGQVTLAGNNGPLSAGFRVTRRVRRRLLDLSLRVTVYNPMTASSDWRRAAVPAEWRHDVVIIFSEDETLPRI